MWPTAKFSVRLNILILNTLSLFILKYYYSHGPVVIKITPKVVVSVMRIPTSLCFTTLFFMKLIKNNFIFYFVNELKFINHLYKHHTFYELGYMPVNR